MGRPTEQASADICPNLPNAYKEILAQLVLCLLLLGLLKVRPQSPALYQTPRIREIKPHSTAE